MTDFIGRQKELKVLQRFLKKKTASLLVIKGRRRIGKSRLIEEFAKTYKFYNFSGIAPTKETTAQSQRNEFTRQFGELFNIPGLIINDWGNLFTLLAKQLENDRNRIILLFDEISWMGSKEHDFLGKLKNAWDTYFKKDPKLIFILCGSASSWIEKNILSSTGFVGRVSFVLTLGELSLRDCKKFWGKKEKNISCMEKLKILSVTGGIPRYLEEIDPILRAEDNIKNLCFTKGALLAEEFDKLFSSLFLHDSEIYKKIINILSIGNKGYKEICEELKMKPTGKVSDYLKELELAGFIKRDYTWHLVSGLDSKLSKYRLSDNYLRFYTRYIDKYKTKIKRDSFILKSLTVLPGWDVIMALQFENLVLNNREHIYKTLGIEGEDIVSENPFFQHRTLKQAGCQIDYMIQTRSNSLYICEIKFSKNVITPKVIDEVQRKINRLKHPKGYSYRPVLIHVNGVTKETIDRDYFFNIIDFSALLEGKNI